MMLHQDGSRHEWIAGLDAMDLIVTMDDATNTIYSGFLVPEEGTASTFQALLDVLGQHSLPLSLYTDRGSHYFYTPEAGGPVGWGSGGSQVSDPGWASAGAAGGRAYCGLFAPGTRAIGASVRNVAGSAGEGAGVGGDRHGCIRQRLYP